MRERGHPSLPALQRRLHSSTLLSWQPGGVLKANGTPLLLSGLQDHGGIQIQSWISALDIALKNLSHFLSVTHDRDGDVSQVT